MISRQTSPNTDNALYNCCSNPDQEAQAQQLNSCTKLPTWLVLGPLAHAPPSHLYPHLSPLFMHPTLLKMNDAPKINPLFEFIMLANGK